MTNTDVKTKYERFHEALMERLDGDYRLVYDIELLAFEMTNELMDEFGHEQY